MASAVCLVWTVGTSAILGYGDSAWTASIFGIPGWVFVSVALPWVAATTFSVWYAMRGIVADPLGDGERVDEDDGHEAASHLRPPVT